MECIIRFEDSQARRYRYKTPTGRGLASSPRPVGFLKQQSWLFVDFSSVMGTKLVTGSDW